MRAKELKPSHLKRKAQLLNIGRWVETYHDGRHPDWGQMPGVLSNERQDGHHGSQLVVRHCAITAQPAYKRQLLLQLALQPYAHSKINAARVP